MTKTEELNQQTNTEPIKKEQLFKTTPITGTPFHVIERDQLFYLTMGNNVLAKPFLNEHDLKQWILDNTYDIIMKMIIIILEHQKKYDTTLLNKIN